MLHGGKAVDAGKTECAPPMSPGWDRERAEVWPRPGFSLPLRQASGTSAVAAVPRLLASGMWVETEHPLAGSREPIAARGPQSMGLPAESRAETGGH